MAKSYSAPTTGFIDNGGVVQLGADNPSEKWDYATLPRPTSTWRIVITGDIPSDKDGTNMSVSFFEGNTPLLSASGTWGVQGQTSATAAKKNWKLKLRNATTGNRLSVKIGDWFALSKITLKAYGDDRTVIRDSLTTELWRQMHRYPDNTLAPAGALAYWNSADFGTHTSALYSTAGFPCEVWHNGAFMGIYVIRSEADNQNYLMDDSNKAHLLIQPQHADGIWGQTVTTDITSWTIQSPALSGYNDQDDISKSFPDTYATCSRVLLWMAQCNAQTQDIRATYRQYLDLRSVIDYILITEVSGSFDSTTNNFMLGSYNANASSGIWYMWPYDEDETWGLQWGGVGPQSDAENVGWVTLTDGLLNKQDPGFFRDFHTNFRPEIRARYRELRDAGIISTAAINKIIADQVALINPDMMAQDIALWPRSIVTGSSPGIESGGKWSVEYIMNYAKKRIAWLDQQWNYYPKP